MSCWQKSRLTRRFPPWTLGKLDWKVGYPLAVGESCMALAVGAGFVTGTYFGFYLVLATMNWNEPFETHMVLATVGLATLLAVVGCVIAAPDKRLMWKPIAGAGVGMGVVSAVVLLTIEAGPVMLILVGLIEIAAIVVSARAAPPSEASKASPSDETVS